jgi:hypothetical protein
MVLGSTKVIVVMEVMMVVKVAVVLLQPKLKALIGHSLVLPCYRLQLGSNLNPSCIFFVKVKILSKTWFSLVPFTKGNYIFELYY